ncbi:MFS transporter [Aspergillus pseudonomiae]|uniref:MFS transporter n=1 Tax=Aspergillus pseudonomiae TaxID=1506151 RepID=A0A5N6IIT4_9EURO|nr:MFS transporter [Aspergillus pseudonomiae]KAB8266276.1 MFS transporter [Aspergillus pseudonomiae]KAE8404432.1 MFS transporter [Aspergillus pseudonomiae]
MASQRALFTASRTQTLTYLLAVCPFSIAFLVYINSSISFVVTELIGLHDGEGDAVGTLGFADELLALVACPLWGVLSDRIGVRHVCVAGYSIIAVALVVLVQATNVYPQLLLGRLLFSIGGSAVSTMVTAVLPTVTGSSNDQESTETADTQNSSNHEASSQTQSNGDASTPSSRLAGFVGMCAGCGALVSLVIFLPLPAKFQTLGLSPAEAIQCSYYVVAAVALLVSLWCLFGLRDLPGEEKKTWSSLWSTQEEDDDDEPRCVAGSKSRLPYLDQFGAAIVLGCRHSDILIGYIGGFVARASSVGISLFIPLFVNHYYRVLGVCNDGHNEGSGDIKHSCPDAYKLASILTGVSQLVALIAAPAFGYWSDKSRRHHLPLLLACLAGVLGYTAFPLLPTPKFSGEGGSPSVFAIMSLIGISQIGAIVCSLAVLSNGILGIDLNQEVPKQAFDAETESHTEDGASRTSEMDSGADRQPLLGRAPRYQRQKQLSHLKGSIAGVYSLFGGAGILLLTKLGGLLFDVWSSGAPFYIMAGFNGALLLAGLVGCLVKRSR